MAQARKGGRPGQGGREGRNPCVLKRIENRWRSNEAESYGKGLKIAE